ncbi:MAG: DUF4397 domain-containing protein [Acidobacteriaceae bacterium]
MKRPYVFLSIFGAGLAGLLAMSGCVSPTVDYQVRQFASLRVMNFAPNCTAPMDIYWDTVNPPAVLDNNAKIYNLQYGASSVYTNSLKAAPGGTDYYVVVTKTRIPDSKDFPAPLDLKLMPGTQYTLMITLDPSNNGAFKYSLIPDDQVQGFDQSKTYVRFINMEPNVDSLAVHVNDPVMGTPITQSGPLNFDQVGPYVPLSTALDTSFAFLVTNPSNQIIARLSYQTFVAGSFYTLIYAGDPCNTVAVHPADTSISALDTFRLRAFDDNSTGNDQTNPIQYSYRYNIINDIYPTVPYDTNTPPVRTLLGFLVNGEGFPEYGGYSIPAVQPLGPGGTYTDTDQQNGGYIVNYQSALLATPLNVQGFTTNAEGTSQLQVFSWSDAAPTTPNPTKYVPQDQPVTFLFMSPSDTVSPTTKPWWAVASGPYSRVLQIPDENYSDSVTLVFISGINSSPKLAGSALNTSFFVSQGNSAPVQPPYSVPQGYSNSHASVYMRFPASAGLQFTISDKIGYSSNQINGASQTFTAVAGGIYEVASMGIKTDNHILIMHVNAKNGQ